MQAAFRPFESFCYLRRLILAAGGVAVVAVGVWCLRGVFIHRAVAQQAPPAQAAAPAVTAAPSNSDYGSRVVAYLNNNQAVTRQELGEYLILRYGVEKLPLMLNQRLLEKVCTERGIVVNGAEVDAALARDMKGLAMPQADFIKNVLSKYKKNLYEWKQDIIRPRLQMARLVQDRLVVTPEEIRKAFESTYGEKVECRIILWPLEQKNQARDEYGKLRDSEEAFADKAKRQSTSALASAGGKIRPIGRYTMDERVEAVAFKLQVGEVSTLIETPQGMVLLKCDRRIPPDTTVNFDAVKEKLAAEIHEQKLQVAIAETFQALKVEARPQPLLQKSDRIEPRPTPPANQVVAYLYGNQPVTREELGEFLIARYGGEKLEFLVNRLIIETACKAKNITVSDKDIDRSLEEDLKGLNVDKVHFEKDLLSKWGKNLFEWREDVIRPKLLLTKLCEGRVRCSEEDLKKCYDAHHGERVECRMILWPRDQERFAQSQYAAIRDSEIEFDRLAKSQVSQALATHGGRIPVFGHNTFGDENVEREVFKLSPGEITSIIGTEQGHVVLKLDKRIPPDNIPLPEVREELTKEVLLKKVNLEMQVVFKELHAKSNPRILLKGTGRPEDLLAESKRLMSEAARK